MKKILLASVLAVMVLGLAAVGWAGTNVEIVYDTYCDGVSIAIGAGGLITGNQTGCLSGPFEGRIKNQDYKFKYLEGSSFHDQYGIHFTIIRHDGTWTHYLNDGSIANSGTWSFAPVAGGGTEPSAKRID